MASTGARQAVESVQSRDAVSGKPYDTVTSTLTAGREQKLPASGVMQQHIKTIPAGTDASFDQCTLPYAAKHSTSRPKTKQKCNVWISLCCSAEGGYAPAPAGPVMHGSTSPVAPTVATPGRLEPQPARPGSTHTTHTHSSSVHATTTPTSSSSSAGAGAVKSGVGGVPGSNLASASTAQGPLVATTVEEGAQTQQVLQLLDNYDFRWGCTAGVALLRVCPAQSALRCCTHVFSAMTATCARQHRCRDVAVQVRVIGWIWGLDGRLPAGQSDVDVAMFLSCHNIFW
jgi:hypothetical protein